MSQIIQIIKLLPKFIQELVVDWFFDQMLDEEGRFKMGGVPSQYNLEDMALDGIALLDVYKGGFVRYGKVNKKKIQGYIDLVQTESMDLTDCNFSKD